MRICLLVSAALSVLAGAASAAPPAYHIASRLALPDGSWDLASFDPAMRRIYIARGEGVTAIDVDTGQVTGRLAPAGKGHAVVPLKGGTEILVTNGAANTADIFDAKTGGALASIKTGDKPDAAAFDTASGLAVVMNGRSGSLTLIDPATRQSVGEIVIGGALELGVGDGEGRLFVNVEDHNEVAVIDLKARKVLTRIALTGCEGPTGIAWLPVSRRLMSSCANGVAVIADPATGKTEKTLPIGEGPDSVLYDPQRAVALIPAGRSAELDLFADEASGVRALGKVATQRGAKTGAVDPRTGRVYLPAADYAPPAAAGGKPQVKPGSVVVLILEP
ncbi:MAG TPA: YncE family protein [Caulobacteraceae bacterium]